MKSNSSRKPETIADRKINSTWFGRSLENYVQQHPKAQGARTLTEARTLAFGERESRVGTCNCKQNSCTRFGHGKARSNC
jgi:hypothetical protein